MIDMLWLVVKVVIIVMAALFLGYKTGLFSLGRIASGIILAILIFVFSLDLYSFFFRPDISLLIIFKSSFLNFTLDFSFFIRMFLLTLILGLICSVCGVHLSAKVNTVRELCILALLIAMTTVLAVYCTFRPTNIIKIPFKFISVFVTAAIFGPLWGGIVGALADIIAFLLFPVGGAPLPQITMIEFLYGFTYGLFFFNLRQWNGFKSMIKIIACVVFQIVFFNLGLTSVVLAPVYKMSLDVMLKTRAIPALINMAIQLVVITLMSKYISSFRKVIK